MTYDTAASGEDVSPTSKMLCFFILRQYMNFGYFNILQGSTETQRSIRMQLVEKLQTQLHDIEKCAMEAAESDAMEMTPGEDGPTSMAEKQRVIIEQLQKRFHFQFGDSLEELR